MSQLAAKDLDASATGSDENDCPAAAAVPTLRIAGATVTESDTDGPLSSNGAAAAAASEQFASV